MVDTLTPPLDTKQRRRCPQGYYTAHGQAALLVAKQFYRTTAVVKGTDSGLPYVNVNRSMFESVLRELLLNSTTYCIELYESTGTGWKLARCAAAPRLPGTGGGWG